MNITKKAISVGISAALLASLVATVAAPAAFADYSVLNTVAVPVGGTSSGTPLSLTFNDASTWTPGLSGGGFCTATAGGTVSATLTYTIKDYAGNSTLSFVGTPTITAPGSLGASVVLSQTNVANDSFTVTITGCDPNNVEQFTVGGLQIAASGSAAPGQIQATFAPSSTAAFVTAVTGSTTTATGTLQSIYPGNTIVTVNTTSTCGFVPSGNTATFGTQTGVGISSVSGTAPGLQTVFLSGSGLTGSHAIGETVTQTVPVCSVILSPGTVGAVATQTATQSAANQQQVNPGENNQTAGTTSLAEPSAGFLAASTTIKFTLSAPGVLFSHAPSLGVSNPAPLSAPTGLTATPLAPGTLAAGTYYYEVTAKTAAGETTGSPEVSATLSGAGEIYLSWNAVAGATSYRVYRGTTSGGESVYYYTTATHFTDTGGIPFVGAVPGSNSATIPAPSGLSGSVSSSGGTILAGTTYFYEVTALVGTGQTTGSAETAVTVTSGTTNSIVLTWNADPGATSYRVYRGTTSGGENAYFTTTATSFTDTGGAGTAGTVPGTNSATIPAPSGVLITPYPNAGTLAAGTYYYEVTATNAAGETTPSAAASATLAATGEIYLTWNAVAGATGYKVYGRPATSGGTYGLLASVSGTSYLDTGSATPGAAPPAKNTTGGTALTLTSTLCNLSFDRTSCTATVNNPSVGAPSTITLSNIDLDVASTVPNGTAVNVNITTIPAVTVSVSSNTIAYVARALVAVSAQAVPSVNIGYNAQQTGVITVTESAPGFFQAGSSGNNQLSLCFNDNNGETFTFAPWAIVTPTTAGGLLLLNPATNTGVTSVAAQLDNTGTCATWYVYSASTVASTVTIVGANASGALSVSVPTDGPTINVPATATPGPVTFTVTSGSSTTTEFYTNVTNAIRVFSSGIAVAAVPPIPFIAAGTTAPVPSSVPAPGVPGNAANITISEAPGGLHGLLATDEMITCQVLNSAFNQNQQVFLSTANSNQLPVVSTNTASGLIAHLAGTTPTSFTIAVDQQAYAPNWGTITVSNINYTVVSGATPGPVILECTNNLSESPGAPFDQFVSNALIGTPPVAQKVVMTADSSLSASGPFSYATKLLKPGQSITIRVRTNPQLAGVRLGVWIAIKGANGTWGAYKPHTSVTTDVNGTAYYTYTFGSKAWLAFRFYYGGDATHAPAWSYPSQFGRAM